jgi:hypothetical protein
LGVSGSSLAKHAESVATLLAIPLLAAVCRVPFAYADATLTCRAEQFDVGNSDRHFFGQTPTLLVLFAWLHVPIYAIDALNHDFIFVGKNTQNAGGRTSFGRTGVVTRYYFNNVVFANIHGNYPFNSAAAPREPAKD